MTNSKDEQLFRLYEEHIKDVCDNYPLTRTFQTSQSADYIKMQMRRAWKYFLTSSFHSPLSRFRATEVLNSVVFSTLSSKSFSVGPRKNGALPLEPSSSSPTSLSIEVDSETTLRAILHLKNTDRISLPITLKSVDLPLDLYESEYPNTAISPTENPREFTLL